MSYVPHPENDPLVKRPSREKQGIKDDEEAEKNRTAAQVPTGQGSNLPGLKDAPPPELDPEANPIESAT